MLVGDAAGRLVYANPAARATVGIRDGGGLAGRAVSEVLAALRVRARSLLMPGGFTAWYLPSDSLAERLRTALLPSPLPSIDGIQLGAAYRASEETAEIGGDFYEVRPEGEGWSFALGDVCGKGVEAAVLTGQVRQSLRTVALLSPDPAARLELLNSALLSTDGASFVTMVHGVMRSQPEGVSVRVAAGGHPAPLLRHLDGSVEEVPVKGPIIGMLPEVCFEALDLVLAEGETLLCFSDGLPDAKGPSGFLGVDRLAEELSSSGHLPAPTVADRCLKLALDHLDGRAHDDMAILAVQVDTGWSGLEHDGEGAVIDQVHGHVGPEAPSRGPGSQPA